MNILKKPLEHELSATMTDFVISTENTVNLKCSINNQLLLDEDYVPNRQMRVVTHHLGDYLAQALWGSWPTGLSFAQQNLSKQIDFMVDGQAVGSTMLTYCCRRIPHIGLPVFLTRSPIGYTRPGSTEYLTVDKPGTAVFVQARQNGTIKKEQLGIATQVTTFDVSLDRISQLLGFTPKGSYDIICDTEVYTFLIDLNNYEQITRFRFKNLYDAPDTISCVGPLLLKTGDKAKTGFLYGKEVKFSTDEADEYSCSSGVIFSLEQYAKFHDFLHSREVEVFGNSEWLPIIISKQDYNKKVGIDLKEVKFSFRMADAKQNGSMI